MISLKKLSNIAILSFKNGYRLHLDSLRLFSIKSYPTATMLSILSMEEFGKYFSISSYVFYTSVNDTRNIKFEDNFLKQLYSHPFKQKACFGRDGFKFSQQLIEHASNRKFEELKQKSLYVGFRKNKGKILYNIPYYNPMKITKSTAKKQIMFLNDLLLDMAKEHINGIIEMDEDAVNELLSERMIKVLESFKC